MKKLQFGILFLLSILYVSCSDDDGINESSVEEGTEIYSFSFLKKDNLSLDNDIDLDIENNKISGKIPYNADVKYLIASFKHNGLKVVINNKNQVSESTINNFSKLVKYTVKTTDGRTKDFEVDITFFTGLPIVYLNTNGTIVNSKEKYIYGAVSIDGGRFYDDFSEEIMKIRGRGNSTWGMHPKKPYQIKFEEKTEILGMPKDKRWVFLAEYSDKTMIRNKVAFEMGYISNLDWTPQSTFAEVFINNEYNGTYNISQKVEESNNRIPLGDHGYLLEIDQLHRLDSDDVYFYTNDFLINIKEPELAYNSTEFNYIKEYINEFENVLKGNQFSNPTTGYKKYIDVDSFVDWYLINEITKNVDAKDYSSIFMNVMPGEKIKMGPIWDFDLAFGNVNYADSEYPEGFWVKHNSWYTRLFEDPAFVSKVKARFSYFRENQDFILDKIDSHSNYLKWAQQENDNKWNTIGNYVWPNPIAYSTYDAEVEHLISWYKQRMNWLENAIMDL